MSSAHRLPHQLFDAANAGAYRIPDPGDGKLIDVTVNGGVCVLTVAASATETRQPANGLSELLGVRLLVFCDTVGSGGTVAVGGLTTFSNTTRKAWFTVRSTSGTYAWVDEDSTLYGSVVSVTSVVADDVTTDVIAEKTTNAGVTIDGVLVKDTGVFNADLTLGSTNEINVTIGGVSLLAVDDAAISGNTAATDTAGKDAYIGTQAAGGTATAARLGGLLNITTGAGSANAGAVAAGAGGATSLTSGNGGANTGGASGQVGGAGGALALASGTGGATNSTGAHASGAGGAVTVTAGAAGSSTGATSTAAGNGGATTIAAGAGGAATAGTANGGIGGSVAVSAAAGGNSTGGTGGAGGSVVVTSAAAGTGGSGVAGGIFLRSAAGNIFQQQTAASAEADGAQAITAAQMINGIVVHTVTGASPLSTPTGATLTAACGSNLAAGDSFTLTVITIGTGADDISTLTAGDGNVTFVGGVTVGPDAPATGFNNYGTWRFRYAGASAWVGYRIG